MLTKPMIEEYFVAEKMESLLFLIIGALALILGILFLFYFRTAFLRGVAVPVLLIGIIQLVVGYSVYLRSDEQRISNVYAFDMNPDQLQQSELPRMTKVIKNFVVYRWVEIVLTVVAVILIVFARQKPDLRFLYGFGIGLLIQSLVMLSADFFAEKRALAYNNNLVKFLAPKGAGRF